MVEDAFVCDLMPGLQELLGQAICSIELLARDSNHVFKLTTASGACYSVRVPLLDPSDLSAFWQQMQDTFDLRYGSALRDVGSLSRLIGESTPIDAPVPVGAVAVGAMSAYVLTWVDGEPWDADDFPDSPQVHEQLGRYLAILHSHRHGRYGRLKDPEHSGSEFVVRANRSMKKTLQRFWSERADVADWFEHRIASTPPDVLASHLAPIMPDISGGQFVYRDGRITGVVDLDSYVIGPREVELATAEMCLTRPEDFRRGYESVLPLPEFGRFREYCRFWLMLCDTSGKPDLEEFLTRNRHFD